MKRLTDVPLWRLLVALSDAEQSYGPASPRTIEIAEAVRTKLRCELAGGAANQESLASLIPPPEKIRDRLAEIARERLVLVSLLKISRRVAAERGERSK